MMMMSQAQQAQQVQQVQQEKKHDQLLTITLDNGKEFAGHEAVAAALQVDVHFAHHYPSWERGTNQNTKGLVRQYFPKDCNFGTLTQEHIEHVMQRLNNRPRKTLENPELSSPASGLLRATNRCTYYLNTRSKEPCKNKRENLMLVARCK